MTITQTPSPNFDDRPDGVPVDMLVLHYTGMKTGEEALDRLCDEKAKVSAHYLVETDGKVFQLVDEEKRAWHAGVSSWRGHTDVNARSIGIEMVNPGHEWGYRTFPDAQIAQVIKLCQTILSRHPIPARNVVGHSDVAPARKEDPGELFPWEQLAAEGVGLWTADYSPLKDEDIEAMLHRFGYDTRDLGTSLMAFERHFHRRALHNRDMEKTQQRLCALLDLIDK
ncbi:MAG: N-acetylmuramoyl-L-alanine amidase [Methylocystaceae bacterium]|nr:N-acetylmuramoyl-L-alanine amidase [Methylocystaceae bacterium]